MKTKSLRIFIKTINACKFLFQFKELLNGDILYSFGALDGKSRSLLFGETCQEIEPGDRNYKYADATIISEPVDHFSLHTTGHHVITSPKTKTEKSTHWGTIIQSKMQTPFEWRPFGIILPAAFERFPTLSEPLNSERDTQIDITALKINWLYFDIGIIGKKLEKDKPGFFGVPSGILNNTATSLEQCFVGALDWFFLPLTSYTMLLMLKAGPDGPPPPRTVFVRWEHDDPAKAHIAYLE